MMECSVKRRSTSKTFGWNVRVVMVPSLLLWSGGLRGGGVPGSSGSGGGGRCLGERGKSGICVMVYGR